MHFVWINHFTYQFQVYVYRQCFYNQQIHQVQIPPTLELLSSLLRSYESVNIKVRRQKSQLDDYELKQQVGRGGFGRVYKAIHRKTQQKVAIKVCPFTSADNSSPSEVQDEIKIHRQLIHEHIAQVLEVIRAPRKIYIVMEYCEKGELFNYINQNGPLGEREAARIFHQILSALIYLRQMGVHHRDIKPQNILFDKQMNVKLVDFGFGCSASDDQMRKTICGTPSYVPPEIVKKVPYSPQLMDVWSLGVTLYAMLAAQLPFDGETSEKKKARILSCRWKQNSSFPLRVNRLFNLIFVQEKNRAHLEDLLQSDFLKNHQFIEPSFIDFKNETVVPQDVVLTKMEKELGFDREKVIQSLRTYKLDRFHATYYLMLASVSEEQLLGSSGLSKYKKQKKASLKKLQPLRMSVDKSKQPIKQEDNIRRRKGSVFIAPVTERLRRQTTPQNMKISINILREFKN